MKGRCHPSTGCQARTGRFSQIVRTSDVLSVFHKDDLVLEIFLFFLPLPQSLYAVLLCDVRLDISEDLTSSGQMFLRREIFLG